MPELVRMHARVSALACMHTLRTNACMPELVRNVCMHARVSAQCVHACQS